MNKHGTMNVVVNVSNISIHLLACPYMVPDLNLLKSTERLNVFLRSQVYSYQNPLFREAGYLEAVLLHHTLAQFKKSVLLQSSLDLPPCSH